LSNNSVCPYSDYSIATFILFRSLGISEEVRVAGE